MAQVKSIRGQEIFIHDGYMYTFDAYNYNKTKKFWRCRYKNDCSCRIHTSTETSEVLKILNNHSHDSEAALIEANKAITSIKQRAKDTLEPTSKIISECISGISEAAKGALAADGAMKKQIKRIRRKTRAAPDAPKDLMTLIIPDDFKTYLPPDGIVEQFLLHDSGPGEGRILIFGRYQSLEILAESTSWYTDGTFKVAPPLFSQIYVIFADYLNDVHPLLYALLPNNKSQTYEQMLKIIINLKPGLKPNSIACDFDQAVIKAFLNTFPGVKIFGCLFHLTKNFRLKVCELDLISKYKNEADFSIAMKMVLALAFVKIDDLNTAIEALTEQIPPEVLPVLDWFEEYYIGRKIRNQRQPPLFPPVLWNVRERILNKENITNNHAEVAIRRLNLQMSVQHSTLWTFFINLRKVQSAHDTFYRQLEAGNSPPKKKKTCYDVDKRIYKIVEDYNKRSIISFLRGIAQNISCY